MTASTVIVLSIIIFSALVINMAVKPAYSSKLTSYLMMISVLGGSIMYGIGYTDVFDDTVLSLVRTPFSVIGMFLGKNDLAAIAGSPMMDSKAAVWCFWVLHLFAFYSIASAAMIAVGADSLRRLRLFLAMGGDLTIIYGINENSIKVGSECAAKGNRSVVFIAENDPENWTQNIINMGMAVISGTGAAESDLRELRLLRLPVRRRIEVYALHTEVQKNLYYAVSLKESLEKLGISPEKTSITLPGTEEILTSMLQVSDEEYGFGYVNVFNAPELMARAMIRLCPPWDYVTFDSEGRAEQDFDCIVIGSGDCGQSALRYLIMNGQYVGSRFHAAMFSPNYEREAGYLFAECRELLRQYDIEFYQFDGRSVEFYEYLNSRLGSVKYIAVCTGSEEMNTEVADHLMLYLKRMRAEYICVLQCTKSGVRYQMEVGSPILSKEVYSYEMLCVRDEDRNAMIINGAYDDSDRSDWEKWISCDPFSKMSSRASAEFLQATVRASGASAEDAMKEEWIGGLGDKKLNILGEMEHMRWCAFYYSNGYRAMTDEEFEKMAENYRRNVREGKPANPRISKDSERHIHACLIPYDQLDALSEREKKVTGRNVNYRQADINNVLIIPEILRLENSEE